VVYTPGRPRHTRVRTLEADLQPLNHRLNLAWRHIRDRGRRRRLVVTAILQSGAHPWWRNVCVQVRQLFKNLKPNSKATAQRKISDISTFQQLTVHDCSHRRVFNNCLQWIIVLIYVNILPSIATAATSKCVNQSINQLIFIVA